jgi:hypothetical protein
MTGFIIFIIVAILSQLAAKAKQAEAKRTPASPLARPDDLEQAARTRRIQEEIRRKIAERRGGLIPPPADLSTPVEEERPPAPPAVPRPFVPPLDPFGGPITRTARPVFERRAPEPPPLPARPSAALARQEEISTQMATLQEKQATAQTTAAARAAETSWTAATRTAAGPSAWRNDLRSPADLRRAIVLRELLGPPVALR